MSTVSRSLTARQAFAALSLLISPLFCASLGHADDSSPPPTTLPVLSVGGAAISAASQSDSTVNLNQPSNAGSRLGLTPLETPASVTVIPGNFIRDWGYTSIVNSVSHAPGITSAAFPGNGNNSVSARGFYGPTSISELYDGTQLMQAGNTVTFPSDPWMVDHIEVLSGPASVLYGLGFVGGAINVVSRQPNPLAQENQAQFSVGSFNTFTEAVDSTGPINSRASYRLDISNQDSDGWVDRGGSSSQAIHGVLRYDVTPDFQLNISNDFNDQHPSTYEGTPLLNGRPVPGLQDQNYNVANATINFVDDLSHVKEKWTPTDYITVENDTYYMHHDRRFFEAYGFLYQPATNTVLVTTNRSIFATEQQEGDHGDVIFKSTPFGLGNEALVGFDVNEATYNRSDNQTQTPGAGNSGFVVPALGFTPQLYAALNPNQTLPQYRTRTDQSGIFAEDRLKITPQIAVVAGLRDDYYDVQRTNLDPYSGSLATASAGYNTTAWHAGVVYNPIPDLALYARYAVAADPPNTLPSISASQLIFKPSIGRQEEVGVKQSLLDDRLEWTFAAYQIVKRDLLTTDPNNINLTDEVGQQSSRGVEGSISVKPFDHWHIEANGTLLKAKFDDYLATVNGKAVNLAGNRPYMVPDEAANAWLTWDFARDWQARAGYQYVGKRFADNTNLYRLPGYSIVGIGARWTPAPWVKFDLRIDNLLNTVYAASTYPGSTSANTQWILGEPLSATATMNILF